MSLRLRLMVSIAVALLLSLGCDAGLACWRALRSVRTELTAAMDVGRQVVRSGIDDIARSTDQQREAIRLVASFDGDRHVVARLIDQRGAVIRLSRRLVSQPSVPGWFVGLVAPSLPVERIALPTSAGGGAIVLAAEPSNEAGEAWDALSDHSIALLLFSLMVGGLALVTSTRALRPLAALSEALDRVGPGHYGMRIAAAGPTDVARLADGFNRMSERLAAIEAQNRRLTEQMLRLQDEERADIARDLHDEVGPFLFSIGVGAAAIELQAAAGELDAIPEQVGLIREDVGHVQRHVRDILARLRPVAPLTFGLGPAIDDLASFWRARNPSTLFTLDVAPGADDAAEPAREAAYRVVQEAVCNAMRHARPRRIGIEVARDTESLTVCVTDDGESAADPPLVGLGLETMRDRVAAIGGSLAAGPRADAPCGWAVTANLPLSEARVSIEPVS